MQPMDRKELEAGSREVSDEVVDLYLYGFSQQDTGRMLGIPPSTIWRRLKTRGVRCRAARGAKGWRKRGGAYFTDGGGYLITKDRDGCHTRIHRGCWKAYHGEIPGGYVIHHVDGNPKNNTIGNLACMTQSEHVAIHNTKRRQRHEPDEHTPPAPTREEDVKVIAEWMNKYAFVTPPCPYNVQDAVKRILKEAPDAD